MNSGLMKHDETRLCANKCPVNQGERNIIKGMELAQRIRKGQYDTSALTVRGGTLVPHVWEAVLSA